MTTAVDEWEHSRVVHYIQQYQLQRVTLQFPDSLLRQAPSIAQELQHQLVQHGSSAKVYVLADTSYNPLSVDEVAAAHVNADCIVHYGYASLHPVSRTPALCILPKRQLDVQQCSNWVAEELARLHPSTASPSSAQRQQQQEQQREQPPPQQQQQPCQAVCVVCCDQGYLHLLPQLQQTLQQTYQGPLQLVFAQGASTELWPAGKPQAATSSSKQAAPCCMSNPSSHANSSHANRSHANCCGTQQTSCHSAEGSAAAAPKTAANAGPAEHLQSPQEPGKVPVGGLAWELPSGQSRSSSSCSNAPEPNSSGSNRTDAPLMVWLGPSSSPALTHLQLSHAAHTWVLLDPESQCVAEGLSPGLDRLLKRRYYLVERARGASMVGLLVGTLGAAGYKTALEQLKLLAAKAGKKTYTLLMGKPNPAKLANFPEIEVFVMLADPQGLILDSKEYLAPIITPHEAYLAFTGREFNASAYRLDFGDLLHSAGQQEQSSSGVQPQSSSAPAPAGTGAAAAQIGGNIRGGDLGGDSDDDEQKLAAAAGALVIAGGSSSSSSQALMGQQGRSGQVQVHSAAQYLLQQRTYKGLETPATGADILPASLAVKGRSGRAAGYVDEPKP